MDDHEGRTPAPAKPVEVVPKKQMYAFVEMLGFDPGAIMAVQLQAHVVTVHAARQREDGSVVPGIVQYQIPVADEGEDVESIVERWTDEGN